MQRLTRSGLVMSEVVSALQKHIRRGEVTKALTMAFEMVPHFRQYLWNRLVIISMEDIGPGDPQAMILVATMMDHFFMFWQIKKEGPCRLALANAVLHLCRAKKSRVANHLQMVVTHKFNGKKKPKIEDWTLDGHTARGKRKGRGPEYFWKESAQLENASGIPDTYEEQVKGFWKGGSSSLGWFPDKKK